jgi:hypothetical protein
MTLPALVLWKSPDLMVFLPRVVLIHFIIFSFLDKSDNTDIYIYTRVFVVQTATNANIPHSAGREAIGLFRKYPTHWEGCPPAKSAPHAVMARL